MLIYIRQTGDSPVFGPFSEEQIERSIRERRLRPEFLVSTNQRHWHRLDEVKRFAPLFQPAPPEPPAAIGVDPGEERPTGFLQEPVVIEMAAAAQPAMSDGYRRLMVAQIQAQKASSRNVLLVAGVVSVVAFACFGYAGVWEVKATQSATELSWADTSDRQQQSQREHVMAHQMRWVAIPIAAVATALGIYGWRLKSRTAQQEQALGLHGLTSRYSRKAVAALVFALLSLLLPCLALIFGPIAIVLALGARKETARDKWLRGRGLATAALVLGIVATALIGLGTILVVGVWIAKSL